MLPADQQQRRTHAQIAARQRASDLLPGSPLRFGRSGRLSERAFGYVGPTASTVRGSQRQPAIWLRNKSAAVCDPPRTDTGAVHDPVDQNDARVGAGGQHHLRASNPTAHHHSETTVPKHPHAPTATDQRSGRHAPQLCPTPAPTLTPGPLEPPPPPYSEPAPAPPRPAPARSHEPDEPPLTPGENHGGSYGHTPKVSLRVRARSGHDVEIDTGISGVGGGPLRAFSASTSAHLALGGRGRAEVRQIPDGCWDLGRRARRRLRARTAALRAGMIGVPPGRGRRSTPAVTTARTRTVTLGVDRQLLPRLRHGADSRQPRRARGLRRAAWPGGAAVRNAAARHAGAARDVAAGGAGRSASRESPGAAPRI